MSQMKTSTTTVTELFVPLVSSLSDNAPGYNPITNNVVVSSSSSSSSMIAAVPLLPDEQIGPICWKCDGKGQYQVKLKQIITCKVCHGKQRLPTKKNTDQRMIQQQTAGDSGAAVVEEVKVDCDALIDNWRIFQKPHGHRWTTDDLVTAWVAMRVSKVIPLVKELVREGRDTETEAAETESSSSSLHYLDLGCGNGSVLMMVSKHLPPLTSTCIGIEARIEAISLARKSIAFNKSKSEEDSMRNITVRNSDFRTLYASPTTTTTVATASPVAPATESGSGTAGDSEVFTTRQSLLPEDAIFDLVTGTPPYFKVHFDINKQTQQVERALIRQGGMPTCKESAPARCEFRGGIEAYCLAASTVLSSSGIFVVCENYLNHQRVFDGAKQAQLKITSVQRVIGKEGKPPLFCVYTMMKESLHTLLCEKLQTSESVTEHLLLKQLLLPQSIEQEDLVVRDTTGKWTESYLKTLREMKYPLKPPYNVE